jgi:hypothetical protein
LSHDAGPVLGLDRISFAGELRQFDLLDVFPVRRLDRDGEPLHDGHDRTNALGSCVPTSLDNGQRSPRKLLRKVVARLLGRKR